MLGEAFYWVFNMSVVGAAAGLIVMLIRLIKRIALKVRMLLKIMTLY